MRLHDFDDFRRHIEFLQNRAPDLNMRTLYLMADGFADVVQKSGFFSQIGVRADFRSDGRGQMRHFHRMKQNILAVAGAESQTAEHSNELGVKPRHARVIDRGFTRFLDFRRNFFFGFFHGFLNSRRLNPAVSH